jgi:hypothetical protein
LNPQIRDRYARFHILPRAGETRLASSFLIDLATTPPLYVAPGARPEILGPIRDGKFVFSEGPFSFYGRLFLGERQLENLRHWAGEDTWETLFASRNGEYIPLQYHYRRYAGDEFQYLLGNRFRLNGKPPDEIVGAGPLPHRVEMSMADLPIGGEFIGACHARIEYNMSESADRHPPYLKRLEILEDGRASLRLHQGRDAKLRFELGDESALADVRAGWLRGAPSDPFADFSWTAFALKRTGDVFEASLADLPGTGFYTLIIVARDPGQNLLRIVQQAAFLFEGQTSAGAWRQYAKPKSPKGPTP